MLKETHIHIKTGNRYGLISDTAKVKIRGIWYHAVIYTDTSGIMYCRGKVEFNRKFKAINPNQ